MRGSPPASAVVFAVIGAFLLVAALVLGILGSFAFIAIASVGMFFIAAALIAQAVPSPDRRAPAVLALVAFALIVFGMGGGRFFYAGWVLFAGAVLLAFVTGARAK